MEELPSRERDERNALMTWTSVVLESFGRGLICLDADFRILHASPLAAHLLGGAYPIEAGLPASSVFGEHLFGAAGALRLALRAGEPRARSTQSRAAHGAPETMLTISAAALDAAHDTGVSYAVVVGASDDERWNVRLPVDIDPAELHIRGRSADRDELRAVLDHYHWQRAEAARALGISRTTLWRKMREIGLI